MTALLYDASTLYSPCWLKMRPLCEELITVDVAFDCGTDSRISHQKQFEYMIFLLHKLMF